MWNGLRDRLLGGALTEQDGARLARAVRHGSEDLAVNALQVLAGRPEPEARRFVEERLGDERVAVRAAAARGLTQRGDTASLAALHAAKAQTDELALRLAVARVRCSGAAGPNREAARETERALLIQRDARTYHTEGGVRRIAFDVPPLEQRLAQELDGPQPPFEALATQLKTAGRREQHAIFAALGMTGDPRALPILIGALRATDVDPGRGFTQRRLAATAIGRIGLRRATPVLLRALSDEALDFEGRPGAGMGIQYPVRTNLLWALGEIADPAAIPTLIGYLGNTSGSAFGGFYLAAMDALWKLGAHAAPALHEAVRSAPDTAAAHALGVLVALGHDPNPWIKDPRAGVSRLATRAGAAP
jgi:HEAT repeat protein